MTGPVPQGVGKRLPVFAVIMAGGRSTRFWPLARRDRPKQLLSLYGRKTLLQQTATRLRRLVPWSRILVVTTHDHAQGVRDQLPQLSTEQLLIEPSGRGTAACLTLVAEWLRSRVGDAVMVAAPADHVIADTSGFQATLLAAIESVRSGDQLLTLGVNPTRAETGYGYIQVGEKIARGPLYQVRRFREKPDAAAAKRWAGASGYLWNSGIFVWRACTYLRAVEQELPSMGHALASVWAGDSDPSLRIRKAYRRMDGVSVDVGILEPLSRRRNRLPKVAVIPAGFDWSDIGSWDSAGRLWGADKHGNARVGEVLAIDSTNCVIHAPKHLVVALGVHDLIIVESDHALLICPRSRAQEVRHVVPELERRGWRDLS